MEASEHIFKVAYVFVTGSLGRDKQSFAVAKHFAPEVIEVKDYDQSLITKIKQAEGSLLVSCGGGERSNQAAYIKMSCGNKAFAIQLMDPYEGASYFDLIVSPIFENKYHMNYDKNVLHVMCMPSRSKRDLMDTNLIGWKNWIAKLGNNPTLVLVGGRAQMVNITDEDFVTTCETICQRTLNLGGKERHRLFFVTAPRTDSRFIEIIKEVTVRYGIPTAISDFRKNRGKDDVLHSSLRFIDDVIVTGDSMSMVSEAVYYGKSVTIADNGCFGAPRYAALHKVFYEKHLAQPLTSESKVMLESERGQTPNPLIEIEAKVREILQTRAAALSSR